MHNVPATEKCKVVAGQHSRGLDHRRPTAKGIPREHAREQNASGTLATCEPIDTAITPLSLTLLDSEEEALAFFFGGWPSCRGLPTFFALGPFFEPLGRPGLRFWTSGWFLEDILGLCSVCIAEYVFLMRIGWGKPLENANNSGSLMREGTRCLCLYMVIFFKLRYIGGAVHL